MGKLKTMDWYKNKVEVECIAKRILFKFGIILLDSIVLYVTMWKSKVEKQISFSTFCYHWKKMREYDIIWIYLKILRWLVIKRLDKMKKYDIVRLRNLTKIHKQNNLYLNAQGIVLETYDDKKYCF